MRTVVAWGAVLGMVFTGGIVLAQQEPIAQRQALMKDNGRQAGLLKGIVVDGKAPLADAVAPADKLAASFAELPGLFPPGSGVGETMALPLIWTDFAGFEGKAKTAGDLAKAISVAAKSGDAEAARTAFARLGQEGCTSCHTTYRKPRG